MKRIIFLFSSGFLSVLSSPEQVLEESLNRQLVLLARERKILDLLYRMNTFGEAMSAVFSPVEGENTASANMRIGGLLTLAEQSIKRFSLELREIQELNMYL